MPNSSGSVTILAHMNREYHKQYSRELGRDMEALIYGHAGQPLLVFPTSMGRFFEYEDSGMIQALGGKLDAIYFCLGKNDVILIVDLPDHVSAAALGSTACASGMARTRTTVLLTVAEADEALSKPVAYRAPGA